MRKGFTLVELLIVIIIIAVLAAVAMPKIYEAQTRAKEAKLVGDLVRLRKAVDQFEADTGYVPTTVAGLTGKTMPASAFLIQTNRGGYSTVVNPPGTGYQGPYLETVPLDPTSGAQYQVRIKRDGIYYADVRSQNLQISLSGQAYITY